MQKRSQRVSPEEIARIANDHPGSQIVVDEDTGYMFLSILNVEYIASLDAEATS